MSASKEITPFGAKEKGTKLCLWRQKVNNRTQTIAQLCFSGGEHTKKTAHNNYQENLLAGNKTGSL